MTDGDGSLVVVVVNYRTEELTRQCVEAVRDNAPAGTRVVVVDVAATPRTTASLVDALGDSVIIIPVAGNCGYGAAVNRGAQEGAGCSYIVGMASDCVVSGRVLSRLAARMASDTELGVLAPGQQRSAAGRRAKVAHHFRSVRREWELLINGPRPLDETADGQARRWLVGACLMFRATAFAQIGGFAEDYFMYAEDIDVCWRLQAAGWRVDTDSNAEMVHLEGASTAQAWKPAEVRRRKMRSEARFYARYSGRLEFLTLTALRTVRVLCGRSTGAVRRRDAAYLLLSAVGAVLSETHRVRISG